MRIPKHVNMAFLKNSSDLLPERRVAVGGLDKSQGQGNCGLRSSRRGRRFGRIPGHKTLLFFICLAVFGFSMFHVSFEAGLLSLRKPEASSFEYVMRKAGNASFDGEVKQPSKKARRQRFSPCDVLLLRSVNYFLEPKESLNVSDFPLRYTEKEEIHSHDSTFHPRFAGHQTPGEREKAFYAGNQNLHCGFVKGPKGFESTGFDLDEKDKKFMRTCTIAVSSCIFGNSDFLRRPTRKLISGYSERNICFVMFVDEQTLSTLSAEGKVPDDRGYIGLWKIVVVRNLPYKDLRKTGKVPKFLSHRLFPSSRYSIWLDSKLRLVADPMKIIEYFLWRTGSEYAISNHYTRHCVWEEVIQNKRLNKYDHRVIDEQFDFYRSDGLVKFNQSDPDVPLPSYVPEGSFIVRAHTPMSNLFSCLWFNEVDCFTSRDQLSFAYTYLKLRRSNPDKPFHLHMFKDCERRALVKLFHHREL